MIVSMISFDISIIETAEARRAGRAAPAAGVGRRSIRRNHRYNHRYRHTRLHNKNYNRIGTTVVGLPSYCQSINSRGVEYYLCDGIYYRPYYHGTQLVFIIVEDPT